MADLGDVRALALEANFEAHGVDAIVTRPAPDDTPIETRLIWPAQPADAWPAGLSLQRQEERKVAALKRRDVPTLPKTTRIVAPPKAGDADQGWIVDGTERVEPDHVRVYVVPDPEWDA